LVDPGNSWKVSKENILYKCGWSPFEGQEFSHRIATTFVNGQKAFENEEVSDSVIGERLEFKRE
jgi:dihydroorotase